MGLLDFMDNTDPAALTALAGGLLSGRGFAQSAVAGVSGYQQALLAAKQRALAEEELRAKMALQAAQTQETLDQSLLRKAQAEQIGKKEASAVAEELRQRMMLQDALRGAKGVDANAVTGVTGPRPEALAGIGARKPIDAQALIASGIDPVKVKAFVEAADLGRPEVARQVDGAMANGQPGTILMDKFGMRVVDPVPKAVERKLANLGGSEVAYNPFGLTDGQTFNRTQSPDSKASNAVAWANNSLANKRFALDSANAGNLVETPEGYARVFGTQSQAVSAPGGGPRPLMGKSSMTEDQGKATNWLVQATNAFGNMQGAMARAPGVEKPGFLDAMAALPSMGVGNAVANSLRSPDRQQFIQGASSLSEALLRAATGAGINNQEAEQKVKELTPIFGEDAATTKQKMESVKLYLDALKVRAGPGAKQAASILGGKPATSGYDVEDPLGLRGGR